MAELTPNGEEISSLLTIVGGIDNAGAPQPMLVDSFGATIIGGQAAELAAAVGNPVVVAGRNSANQAQSIRVSSLGDTQVVGRTAEGAPQLTNPVLIGGRDASFNVQMARFDSSGRLITTSSGGSGTVVGQVADNAAVAGTNPVYIAGVDAGGLAQNLLVDTSGRPLVVGAAAHDAVVAGNPVLMGYEARNANPSDVGNGDAVRAIADLSGRQITQPIQYAEQASATRGPVAFTMNNGANVEFICIAAPGAGLCINVVWISVWETSNSPRRISFRQGTGVANTRCIGMAHRTGGQLDFQFNAVPWKLPPNTDLRYVSDVADTNNVLVTIHYFIAP